MYSYFMGSIINMVVTSDATQAEINQRKDNIDDFIKKRRVPK